MKKYMKTSEAKKSGFSINVFVPAALCLLLLSSPVFTGPHRTEVPPIAADRFKAIINRISENGGYFWNDNYVSNEASYLHPLGKMEELGIHGGIYIGVGPDQNFTYIAKIRPRYSFILDIRRQNWLEHLLFKALFYLASDRSHYLSLLLSRPVAPGSFEADNYTVQDLVSYFKTAQADYSLFGSTQSRIRSILKNVCGLNLTERDLDIMERIHLAFYSRGLSIKYDFIPVLTYGELLVEKDLEGRMQNFLNSADEFRYIKQSEEENRIIPIVGDFAGPHAFKELGAFLKENNERVKVIYASNVEQYLVKSTGWPNFIQNIKELPLDNRAVFIRTHWSNYIPHPEQVAGYHFTQVLQWVKPFLDKIRPSTSISYWDIVTADTIRLK
jgi:hypothetical protein